VKSNQEPRRILDGIGEPIFSVLPERVLTNLRSRVSENALVWNLFYPITRTPIDLGKLLDLPVLWGTQTLPEVHSDSMEPYFWGFGVDGSRLSGLAETLDLIDGGGLQTEIDLILVGSHNLIAVEAKRGARPGRCQRYQASRCPEIHPMNTVEIGCRYWHEEPALFSAHLRFGQPPKEGQTEPPPCHRHYQLARTLLIGRTLADRLGLQFHLWMVIPARRWRGIRSDWVDFTERIDDSQLWRRLRVIAWREIQNLPAT
jgi:hypothetical protein